MGIYVFSVRDARIDGKVNYVGLIPKLFDNLYGTNRKVSDIFDKDILNKKSKMDIFFDLLSDKNNLLWKDYDNHTGIFQDYLSLNDKIKIVYLNILQFKKENTNKV